MCMPAFPYPRLHCWLDWPLRVCRSTQGAAGARAQAALHAGDGAVGVGLAMLVGCAVTGQASTGVLGVVWLFRVPTHRSPLTRCAAASADADSCAAVPLKPSFLGCVRVPLPQRPGWASGTRI